MRLVAVEAVEVLLDHQHAVACDEERVDVRCVHRVHRHVDEQLHEPLDGGAVEAGPLERADRPAVGQVGRRRVGVRLRAGAARIEAALCLIVDAAKVVGVSPYRHDQRVAPGVVGAGREQLVG